MPKPIVALAKRYQRDAHRISTVGDDRGHGDIDYLAVTVAPADIENSVVNLLRLHEAETAMLFCATRDNVRHLHASLIERGFSAVALSGEHSQSERNSALQALRDRRARVCVATDVAARGIDLPSLSLVIHVELPRDMDTLKHRSGRTGRAGKKGTALMIVPYPRRRRLESMLRGANINAQWINAPSAEDIRRADHDRLLDKLRAPVEADDADRKLAETLLGERTAEDIAIMLVQAHRAQMPLPEELLDADASPAPRDTGPRPGFEDTVWFTMNIGRRQNADPRWLLPLLCRRGHITRSECLAIAGNHCQGTKFLDGADLITPELEKRFDEIALSFEGQGFDFGRFDIRYTSDEALKRGEGFAIVELNGAMSESTNMYDPGRSIFWTYSVLAAHWRLLVRIGAARRSQGVKPMPLRDLVYAVRDHYKGRPGSEVSD